VGNQLTKQCCEVLTVFKAFGWATHNKAFSVSVPVCVRAFATSHLFPDISNKNEHSPNCFQSTP